MAFSTITTIPLVGFGLGTALYKGFRHNVDFSALDQSIIDKATMALDVGFRHLDLAEMYGNDREVAVALSCFYDTHPGLTRQDLWITSKLAESMANPRMGCKAIIERLGCDYLDLLLLHCPMEFARQKFGDMPGIAQVWHQMEMLVEEGLVKNIGVSNFRISDLQELLQGHCRIPPCINQVEFNPYVQQPDLKEFCWANGIRMAAYSPLGTINHWPGGPADRVIEELAAKYNVSPTHLLLKYTNQKGYAAITTTSSRERAINCLSVMSSPFMLTEHELAVIDETGAGHKNRKYWREEFGKD
jgi:diketogulonate reductase-like aldo/keto reductase